MSGAQGGHSIVRKTLTMTFRTFLKEKVEEVPEKKRAKEELREGRFTWD